jgi:hypothetical protein
MTATTSGFEWIDFSFADLTLTSGKTYHIEITFDGIANQEFFYLNNNVVWSQAGLSQLDGTSDGNTINNAVAAIRVNSNVVPIPAAVWLFGSGLGLLGWLRRRTTA